MVEGEKSRFGILFKMLLFFLLISLVPLMVLGIMSIHEMNVIKEMAIDTSSNSLEDLGKSIIELKARMVAENLETYLTIKKKALTRTLLADENFVKIAKVQVGQMGTTELYEQRTLKFLIYPEEEYIGTSIMDTRDKFPEIVAILQKVGPGEPADGFYNFADSEGHTRKKYMFAAPVADRFILAASTFMDEFSAPTKQLEKDINKKSRGVLTYFTFIIFISAAVVTVLAFVMAGTITRPIKFLTEAANKISMGQLDFNIEVKSKDEIGQLALAVERLQQSLNAAIERLRKKKS